LPFLPWEDLCGNRTLHITHLSWIYTSSLRMRLPHCFPIFYNLAWFCSIKVSNKKLQCNAENACGNQMCKRAFNQGIKMWMDINISPVEINLVYQKQKKNSLKKKTRFSSFCMVFNFRHLSSLVAPSIPSKYLGIFSNFLIWHLAERVPCRSM